MSFNSAEQIVREFVANASREAGRCRREQRKMVARAEGDPRTAAAMDARAAEAVRVIEEEAERARQRIEAIADGISWRTLRNRLRRIDRRLLETKGYIGEQTAAAKAMLEGRPDPPKSKAESEKLKARS